MIRKKRAFHDPDVTDFAKTRGKYTTSFVECDEQIKRWLTAHGIVGAEVILVCARLPDRFVILTNTSVWWMEDQRVHRVDYDRIRAVAPPRYSPTWAEPGDSDPKRSDEYRTDEAVYDRALVIQTIDGELLRFPVEPGYPLGAFWNIIRLLSP